MDIDLYKAVLIQNEMEKCADRVLILKNKLKQFCKENNISKSSIKEQLKKIKKKRRIVPAKKQWIK